MLISVDVGFGDVKYVADGGCKGKFPTAVAPYTLGSLAKDSSGLYDYRDLLTFEGKDYLIGESALLDENCKTTRSSEFILKYSPLFIYKVLKEIGSINALAVGVPLGMFVSRGFEDFKYHYQKRLAKFMINSDVIEIPTIHLFAQGHGIYIDYLNATGAEDNTVLVVDIGFNTIDILSVIKGVPQRKGSKTLHNSGVVRIVESLQDYIASQYSFELSEQAAKDVLSKGSIKLYGAKQDLTDIISGISNDYAVWLIEELKTQKDDFLKKADKLIIAGGGAYFVKPFIPREYSSMIYIPDEPDFANARGFYLMLKELTKGE